MSTTIARRRSGLAPTLYATAAGLAALLTVLLPGEAHGQEEVRTESERVITISRGSTAILTRSDSITRIAVADPEIAEPVVIPPNQLLINAINPGSTTLIVWGRDLYPRMYTVEVTADVASLQRQIDELFPDAGLSVASTGTSIVLSGEVRDPQTVRKARELAETMGIPIVDNVQAPPPEQILLHVEFAEVSKSALRELGRDLIRILNPQNLDDAFGNDDTYEISSISEGIVSVMVEGDGAELNAILRALKSTGDFQSLAQPNLVTREGQPASFLAGGEFPFPVVQAGNAQGGVTVTWKEFGIRLNFTPTITNTGNVRLLVAPEVSSLDFANGLTLSGFNIPSILARRVETDVELRPGQTLAIGGLMDNSMLKDVDKFPILGDIPLLGYFFKSERIRQNHTELLVLVTPYVLDPNALPAPPLPTGPASDWEWDSHIGRWLRDRADMERLGDPPAAVRTPASGGG
ncbi:MAG: pilus assembly protein N-terminal domain-containing protein, partial [Longimicrobiales bacterium]|nr:pilus assembly protein N-terminal domain-containing protein [Longimicrobiales bacterium]